MARDAVESCRDEFLGLRGERRLLRVGLWSLGELGFEDACQLLREDRSRRRGPEPGSEKSCCAVCFGETHELDSFTVFQCGHWLCAECAGELEGDRCPVCRERITSRQPLFL